RRITAEGDMVVTMSQCKGDSQAVTHKEYRTGEVYACTICGIEVTITKICSGDCTKPFLCCGQPLIKKS
ncbi:MAG: hypothetical protein ACE5KO_03885, partial [Candidatus Bathyarchaeia archaeon]